MYHTCRINGRETVLEHQTGDMVIATGLSTAETHTIWCGRNTEAFYGKTILEELLVDAGTQFLEPPSLDGQLRVEFIGDSITAGWVVLNSAGSYINQNQTGEDIFQTWDRHLADAWGTADWRAVARTGVGVFPYQAYGIQFHAIQNRFLCSEYSASVCCPLPWDFAVWQADVVVINMGTNDHIPLNPNKPSAARFQGGYEELLTTVRAKYPGALILCLVPLIYTCDRESRYNNMYQGLTDAVRAMEDEKIRLHTTGTREAPWLNCYADYVDGTHPTREGGQKFADRLLPTLTPDVRRFFPLKCGGTGPRCAQGGKPTTLPPRQTTTRSTSIATTGTTSAGPAPGDAECCYPDCANSERVCNTKKQSPFCTSSAANCRSCGGELCTGGGGSPSTTPTVPTTLSSTIAATTTSEGTTSAGPAPGDAECCYPDCGDSQRVCNTEEQSPFCTSSAANCRSCGGELCTGGRRDIFP
ncbi:celE [Symbiodinium sp. KB8]|nr:celE [Symbiodinium sp. KB8]